MAMKHNRVLELLSQRIYQETKNLDTSETILNEVEAVHKDQGFNVFRNAGNNVVIKLANGYLIFAALPNRVLKLIFMYQDRPTEAVTPKGPERSGGTAADV